MASHELIFRLAKLVIAAAWADGELSNDELNSLKDLLFNLPEINEEDWARLKLYMDSPVAADEAERLMQDVIAAIRGSADRELVVRTLDSLVHSDGKATSAETEFVNGVKAAVGDNRGILGGLRGSLKRLIRRRSESAGGAPNREEHFEDFVRNEIYHGVVHVRGGNQIRLPDGQLRKLCLAAGLMAAVAHTESVIDETELQAVADTLKQGWGLTEEEARLLAEVSCEKMMKGLDFQRLCRAFFDVTQADERAAFLHCLFQIALADGQVDHDEIERIRTIAKRLKLDHQDFIAAKLTVPGELRGGL